MKIWIFLTGAVCGALVYALLTGRSDHLDESKPVTRQIEPSDSSVLTPNRSTQASENEQKPSDQPIDENATIVEETAAEAIDTRDWAEQQRGKFDSEEKDIEWAYFNEQAIQQFLARHQLSLEFQISQIECRSTICRLEVVGFDASTGPSWQRIMYDLNQEPWASFGQVSNSFENRNGQLVIVQELHRQAVQD